MCAAPGGPLPGADESITEAELIELESLVDGVGWPTAKRLLLAVSGLERREHLPLVTHRELATLRIALAVAVGTP